MALAIINTPFDRSIGDEKQIEERRKKKKKKLLYNKKLSFMRVSPERNTVAIWIITEKVQNSVLCRRELIIQLFVCRAKRETHTTKTLF
jgi:hypothetical protein